MPLPTPPFAGETEDTIRDRMLDAVDDSFIKTEGDIVYDMLQPAALEVARLYMDLEVAQSMAYPATATGEFLDALALQYTGQTRITDETDDHFRARVLAAMGAPTGAGTETDYRTWVSSVPGAGPIQVVNAGAGALTVYAVADDHTVPDGTLLAAIQAVLDADAPVGQTPTATAATLAYDGAFVLGVRAGTSAQLATWTTAVQAYFGALAPGADFNLYAMLAAVGIASSNYVTHSLDGDTDPVITIADGHAIHVTSVGVGV